MKISNHLLFDNEGKQVSFKPTPNKGGRYTPQYLVMHYTAATTAESAISWFMTPIAQASAHLLIDRDGTVTQFAAFNIICWHAGKSQWNGLVGMNQFSIGIELVNAGRLQKSGDKWICPVDQQHVADDEVIIATHKNENTPAAWQQYSGKQLEVAIEIAALLVKTYGLKDVVGHDDISPIRKSDPGPAFPTGSFRSKVMGRKDETIGEFITAEDLNIRSGAGTAFSTLSDPLPKGTKVSLLKSEGTWSFVEVMETVHGIMDLEGWVSSKFLIKA
ncbi:N-acetylmuramoyl-L-alanine amidase [Pedobacter sp. HMF7647]|uniref:N-acetylmuramoyl-L-alanine amidase n=1 Tax=Hufsiella arboris TaxID=2695275 RepID=A0A7K1Y5G4_9SPHI|nr:N-acetylmuramoyl-L-alanine amidase [Hufsiella arboris]MXV49817.1 N-acetylmuramoyl-L-alanine amidase [Hufsiella arboris]